MKYPCFIVASGIMLSSCFVWGMFNKLPAVAASHVARFMRYTHTCSQSSCTQHPQIAKLEHELKQQKAELDFKKDHFIDWRLLRDSVGLAGGLGAAIVVPIGTHIYTNNLGLSGGLALAEALTLWGGCLYFHLKEEDITNREQDVEQLQRTLAEHQKNRLEQLQKEASERILDTK
jgi:hypothetical protein